MAGALGTFAALLVMMAATAYWELLAGYVALQIFSNAAGADALNRHSALSGYRYVFGTAALFFLLGTVLVSR